MLKLRTVCYLCLNQKSESSLENYRGTSNSWLLTDAVFNKLWELYTWKLTQAEGTTTIHCSLTLGALSTETDVSVQVT